MTNSPIFLSQLEIPTRWADMDVYGHINNVLYSNYMTETRAKFFSSCEIDYKALHVVLVETHCQYKKAFYYPDIILLKQYLAELDNSSMTFRYEFYLAHDPNRILHAIGTNKLVCYDPLEKRVVRIPPAIKQKILANHIGDNL